MSRNDFRRNGHFFGEANKKGEPVLCSIAEEKGDGVPGHCREGIKDDKLNPAKNEFDVEEDLCLLCRAAVKVSTLPCGDPGHQVNAAIAAVEDNDAGNGDAAIEAQVNEEATSRDDGLVVVETDQGKETRWLYNGVLDSRIDEKGQLSYLIDWQHHQPTWQPHKDLKGCDGCDYYLWLFHQANPGKPGPPKWYSVQEAIRQKAAHAEDDNPNPGDGDHDPEIYSASSKDDDR
jgi:hypothetical protein